VITITTTDQKDSIVSDRGSTSGALPVRSAADATAAQPDSTDPEWCCATAFYRPHQPGHPGRIVHMHLSEIACGTGQPRLLWYGAQMTGCPVTGRNAQPSLPLPTSAHRRTGSTTRATPPPSRHPGPSCLPALQPSHQRRHSPAFNRPATAPSDRHASSRAGRCSHCLRRRRGSSRTTLEGAATVTRAVRTSSLV
jgi:hypothetical protein